MLVGKASVLNLPSLMHWAVHCQVRPEAVQQDIPAIKGDPPNIFCLPSHPMRRIFKFNTTLQS